MSELYHFNKNHDKLGRFTFSRGISLISRSNKNNSGSVSKKEKSEKVDKGLSDKQKRAIKIGAAATVGALAVVGGVYLYKTGALDGLISSGKSVTEESISSSKITNINLDDKLASIRADKAKSLYEDAHGLPNRLSPSKTPKDIADAFGDLHDGDPLKKGIAVDNNCTNVFLAAMGRLRGYNVAAGYQKDADGNFVGLTADEVFKCFKSDGHDKLGNNIIKESKGSFFDSYDKASSILCRKYPEGSIGYLDGVFCPRPGKKSYEHAVTWQIKKGKLLVGDGLNGLNARDYFSMLTPNDNVHFFRADNLDFNWDEYLKRVLKL